MTRGDDGLAEVTDLCITPIDVLCTQWPKSFGVGVLPNRIFTLRLNIEQTKPPRSGQVLRSVCFLAIFIQITRIIRSFSRCYLMRGLFEALIRLGKGAIVLVGESQYLRENISWKPAHALNLYWVTHVYMNLDLKYQYTPKAPAGDWEDFGHL